jgi:hypothetical protein
MEPTYIQLRRKSPVRSVHVLHVDADGTIQREKLYERRRRRGSKRLRPFEKAVRRMSRAQGTMADDYLSRHERSNRRKKNGWMKDLGKNVSRSSRKGLRKMKIRIF